jgi:hypothetical protein
MESEMLLEMTASERLTLEEESEMQKTWLEDENSKINLKFLLIL